MVAARLSETGKHSVCVLEAGPPDRNPFIHIPAGVMYTLQNPKINWLYTASGSEGTAGREITQPRGKTLGGSGSINGHIYSRGHRMDFDSWAQKEITAGVMPMCYPISNAAKIKLALVILNFMGAADRSR